VADRENHRVQVFDGKGKFEAQWHDLHRPCGLCMNGWRKPMFYIGELGPDKPFNRNAENLGPRVSIVTHEGKILARLGRRPPGVGFGQFLAPHGFAVDSRGDIYVGEVAWTAWPLYNHDEPRPKTIRALQKLVKLS